MRHRGHHSKLCKEEIIYPYTNEKEWLEKDDNEMKKIEPS